MTFVSGLSDGLPELKGEGDLETEGVDRVRDEKGLSSVS